MRNMKQILIKAWEICEVCIDNRGCEGCVMNIEHNNCIVKLSGKTKQILEIQRKPIEMLRKAVSHIAVILLCIVMMCGCAYAENIDVDKLADAIYKAENSKKYPYGIKSIDTKGDKVYARKICINSINNNLKRYEQSDKSLDFITFMGNRYCPVSEHELNNNWVKNVKYFYYK